MMFLRIVFHILIICSIPIITEGEPETSCAGMGHGYSRAVPGSQSPVFLQAIGFSLFKIGSFTIDFQGAWRHDGRRIPVTFEKGVKS